MAYVIGDRAKKAGSVGYHENTFLVTADINHQKEVGAMRITTNPKSMVVVNGTL